MKLMPETAAGTLGAGLTLTLALYLLLRALI